MSISFPKDREPSDYCPICHYGWWLHPKSVRYTNGRTMYGPIPPCDEEPPPHH